MGLKTDYKDAMFDGQRRYRLIANEDGTYSLPDETTYTQEGDKFGANDINATNAEVNRIGNGVAVTLAASGWSSSAPYSQSVSVAGLKATDVVHIYPHTPHSLPASTVKQYRKMAGMITDGESADGTMTFYCGEKKPTADFQVYLEGVSADG